MASQSNQGGGGPATPPDQTVPTAASAEDFTRYVSLATDVLRATAGQRLLERCAAAVGGDTAALDQVWNELKSRDPPLADRVAAEIKARDPPLADRVELMASHADEFMRLIKVALAVELDRITVGTDTGTEPGPVEDGLTTEQQQTAARCASSCLGSRPRARHLTAAPCRSSATSSPPRWRPAPRSRRRRTHWR